MAPSPLILVILWDAGNRAPSNGRKVFSATRLGKWKLKESLRALSGTELSQAKDYSARLTQAEFSLNSCRIPGDAPDLVEVYAAVAIPG